MKKLYFAVVLAALAGAAVTTVSAQQASASPCQLGGMLAHKAYLAATFDAKYPDAKRLHYMVDYWGDMMVAKHDRKIAHGAVDHIAARLKDTGMRQPWDGAVYEAAREYIVRECPL